jgi:excisionase family DNA binding protein
MAGGKTVTEPIKLLTVTQAAERLGLSRTTVYGLIRREVLRVVKIGKSVRIRESVLERFILEHERTSPRRTRSRNDSTAKTARKEAS